MDREDFLRYTYEAINADLKFAETKNTFLTSFNLAVIGATISFVFSEDVKMSEPSRCWFLVFLIIVLTATLISIFSFFPVNQMTIGFKPKFSGKEHFMFYKYNKAKFCNNVDGFMDELNNYFKRNDDFNPAEKQLAMQIIDLSSIVYTKYALFSIALIVEIVSFPILIISIWL